MFEWFLSFFRSDGTLPLSSSVQKLEGVNNVSVNFMTNKMNLELDDKNSDVTIEEIKKLIKKIEPDVTLKK